VTVTKNNLKKKKKKRTLDSLLVLGKIGGSDGRTLSGRAMCAGMNLSSVRTIRGEVELASVTTHS